MDLKIRRVEGEVLRARPSDKIQNGKGFKCGMPIVRHCSQSRKPAS